MLIGLGWLILKKRRSTQKELESGNKTVYNDFLIASTQYGYAYIDLPVFTYWVIGEQFRSISAFCYSKALKWHKGELKEIISQTELYLVVLKTYVFEDKLTKY